MPVATKPRDSRIDTLKGLAIILVVSGHAVEVSFSATFHANILWNLIYSFHMPLFAFLSGLVQPTTELGVPYLRRRAVGLMLPYVSWLLIVGALSGLWDGLWYLWVLFASCVVLAVSRRIWGTRGVIASVLPLAALGLWVPARNLAWVYPFFVAGYLWRLFGMSERLRTISSRAWLTAACVIAYPLLLSLIWPMMGDEPRWWFGAVPAARYLYFAARYAAAATIVIPLVLWMPNSGWMAWLGRISLGIYAIQWPILWLLSKVGLAGVTGWAIAVVIALVGGAALTTLIDRTPLRLPLLGKPLR